MWGQIRWVHLLFPLARFCRNGAIEGQKRSSLNSSCEWNGRPASVQPNETLQTKSSASAINYPNLIRWQKGKKQRNNNVNTTTTGIHLQAQSRWKKQTVTTRNTVLCPIHIYVAELNITHLCILGWRRGIILLKVTETLKPYA